MIFCEHQNRIAFSAVLVFFTTLTDHHRPLLQSCYTGNVNGLLSKNLYSCHQMERRIYCRDIPILP